MKKRFIISGLAAFTLLGVSAVAAINHVQSVSAITLLTEDYFEDHYSINSIITLPSVTDVYFKDDGNLCKPVSAEIVFPNGVSQSSGKYVLELPGIYNISYYDAYGHSFKKSFAVNKTVYECGKNAEANYVNNLPAVSGTPGINVTLTSGNSFTFNKIVNIYDFSENVVDVCNIYPIFRNSADDKPAASFCTIKLVDAYNADKFLEFYSWCDNANMPYYVGAGSSEQNFTGLEYNPNRPDKINCVYEGVSYNRHVTTRYQTVDAYGVWTGSNNTSTLVRDKGISFDWDLTTNKVFLGGTSSKLVTDLDAPEVYDTNTLNIHDFFTTGEVYAKFECFGYNSSSFNLQIKSILGLEGNALKDAIIEDTTGPSIEPTFLNGKDSICISKGEKFYIPKDVSVFDYHYHGDLKTSVYYNYGQADQTSVFASDYFIPEYLGTYSLVYTARDGFGNIGQTVIPLNCVNEKPFIYDETKLSTLNAAEVNHLPNLNPVGQNDEVKTSVVVKDPTGKEEVVNYDVETNSYPFVPLYVGNYEIRYEIKDSYYSTFFSYEAMANDVGSVYFAKTPSLYPYYIKNASYSLNPFEGYKASKDGAVAILTTPSISFDGGTFNKVNNPNEVKITGNNKIQFKFTAGDKEYLSEEIGIVDVHFGEATSKRNYIDYFQGEFINKSAKARSLEYTFANQGKLEFINLISFSNFALNFTISDDAIEELSIKVEDYVDPNTFVNIHYVKVGPSFYQVELAQKSKASSNRKLGYISGTNLDGDHALNLQGNILYLQDVAQLDVVKNFELAKLTIEVKGSCTLGVKKINNQNMGGGTQMIEAGPQGYYINKSGSFDLDTIYDISPCIASSVLSPVLNKNITLDVTGPNEKVINSTDGKKLSAVSGIENYSIKLTDCGQYRVNYTIDIEGSDRNGAATLTSKKVFYIINVNDTIAPKISFSSNDDVEISKGTTLTIRSYTVSDNYTKEENLRVYIMVVDDHNNIISSGYRVKECSFYDEGTFYVLGYVFDEYGNSATARYKVIVRG